LTRPFYLGRPPEGFVVWLACGLAIQQRFGIGNPD
jgi:hypothetical protein